MEGMNVTTWGVVKWVLGGLLLLVVLTIVGFGLDILNIQGSRITKPMKENVDRQVFENTQSYVFGKRQELAKTYGEWIKADSENRKAIEEIIKVNFSDFPADQIKEDTLRTWLISVRGY